MTLEALRTFLGWSAIGNLGFLTLWFLLFVGCQERIFRLHSRWFQLSRQSFATIMYAAMAGYKLAVFLFFVIPYLVLRFAF